jgi:hypothetical protein
MGEITDKAAIAFRDRIVPGGARYNPEKSLIREVFEVVDADKVGGDGAEVTDAVAFRSKLNIQQVWPEDYGAVGDGVTNDAVALQDAIDEACSAGRPLMLTKYYYSAASLFATDANFTIQGMGPTMSRITFADECQLHYTGISDDVAGTQLVVDGISFRMDGNSSKSVLKIEYAASGLGRQTQHATITNVDIRGVTNANGFLAGIECINVQNSDFSNIYISGDSASVSYPVPPSTAPMTLPTSGAGISFAGSDNPTDIRVRACRADFCYAGFKIRGPIEGIYFSECTTVGTVIGIDDNPGASTAEPLLVVSDSHFNCYWRSISMVNRVQSTITNNLLYGFFGATISGANYTGIYMENNYILPAVNTLSGNCISYDRADRVANPAIIGIDIKGSVENTSIVSENTIYGATDVFDVGVNLDSDSNKVVVEDNNIYVNVTTPVLNAAGSVNTVKQSLRADGAGSVFLAPTANGYPVINFFTPNLLPDANGTRSLGGTSFRWSLIAGVNGDYSGNVSVGGAVGASGGFIANTGAFYSGQGSSGAVRAMMRIDTSDRIHIGEGSSELVAYKTLVPNVTGAYNLGDARRWNGIFLVNAPDVSSDKRLKIEVEGPSLDLLAAIRKVKTRAYTRTDSDDGLINYGPFAQDIVDAFSSVGEDAFSTRVVSLGEDGFLGVNMTMWQALKIAALEADKAES